MNSLRDCVSMLELAGATDYTILLGVRYVTDEHEAFNEQPVKTNGGIVM